MWYRDLAKICESKGRVKVIADREGHEPYLTRYYPLFEPGSDFQGFNVVIHHFHKSDTPVFHDHPWPFVSVVLNGEYLEHTPLCMYLRTPGSKVYRRAKDLHWVELVPGEEVWTMVLMGTRERSWNFLNENGIREAFDHYLLRHRAPKGLHV